MNRTQFKTLTLCKLTYFQSGKAPSSLLTGQINLTKWEIVICQVNVSRHNTNDWYQLLDP